MGTQTYPILRSSRGDQTIGHRPDVLAIMEGAALARQLERQSVAVDLDADQLAIHTLDPDSSRAALPM